jgi:hypothetical protein
LKFSILAVRILLNKFSLDRNNTLFLIFLSECH